MKGYDTGILTFWNVPNYGTFAQAYALQKVIQVIRKEFDVRQIAHLDQHHYNFYFDIQSYYGPYKIWEKRFWKSFFVKNKIDEDIERKKAIFLDAYNTIPHTTDIDRNNVSDVCFNKIFLGSDIIWDFTQEPFNKDEMLFGGLFLANEINAYAASFGTVKMDEPLPEYVVSNIKKMKNISVRDEKSAEIIQKITGVYPTIVLDPVWMWDFEHDKNIEEPNEDNYILVYGQDFTDNFVENLIFYARENGLKIIALDCNDNHYNWCDKLVRQQDLNPYLWIGYFKKASAVATSTFHGLTFGLVFKKKIAFCKSDFILAKVEAFLKQVDLYDLFDNKDDVKKMLSYAWDYKKIDEFIESERTLSFKYLEKACV